MVSSTYRQQDLVSLFIRELDQHILELKNGKAEKAYEIRDIAARLHVHPVHLSNTIKKVTGRSSCDHFEERLVQAARELLLNRSMTIAQVARQLTYDPSNFTKFFRHFTGMTPKAFRNLPENRPRD